MWSVNRSWVFKQWFTLQWPKHWLARPWKTIPSLRFPVLIPSWVPSVKRPSVFLASLSMEEWFQGGSVHVYCSLLCLWRSGVSDIWKSLAFTVSLWKEFFFCVDFDTYSISVNLHRVLLQQWQGLLGGNKIQQKALRLKLKTVWYRHFYTSKIISVHTESNRAKCSRWINPNSGPD